MANGDGVVSDQDVFHYEPYDALAFHDTQRTRSTVEPREERSEGLRQAKEGRLIIGLVRHSSQLSAERLFAAGVVQAYAPATVRSTSVLLGKR